MADSDEWQKPFNDLAESRDSDYYLFSGSIYESQTDKLIEAVRRVKTRRTNGCLILCTLGGNADCAYQIARIFKRRYKSFILYVFGDCKSAGTLVAIGANEIAMSEFGQFGPLDVQLADKEELFGQTPALDVQQSLATLSKFTFDTFFDYFMRLDPGRGLSTKVAAEVAKSLSLGIITPIAAQIDPLLLGRVDRSMKIAEAYSERLLKDFKGKQRLSGGYPSHSFVIDFEEAKSIFTSVREPDEKECLIEELIRGWRRVPKPSGDYIGALSKEKQIPQTNDGKNDSPGGQTTITAGNSETKVSATAPAMGASTATK